MNNMSSFNIDSPFNAELFIGHKDKIEPKVHCSVQVFVAENKDDLVRLSFIDDEGTPYQIIFRISSFINAVEGENA